jgi:hypothetical protein
VLVVGVVAILAVGGQMSVAGPATKKLEPCSIAGPALAVGNGVMDGLVATPDGRLVVLANDGTLHAYRIREGTSCALDVDRDFGHGGTLDVGIAQDPVSGRLDVDAHGTLYAMLDGKRVRVDRGHVKPMCGDALLAASPESELLWRWLSLTDATHETADCKVRAHANLVARPRDFIGSVWAIDDRVVAGDNGVLRLFDGDGTSPVTLANPDGINFLAHRFVACGDKICGAGMYEVATWDTAGHRLGAIKTPEIRGFAALGETGYVIVSIDGKHTTIHRIRATGTW